MIKDNGGRTEFPTGAVRDIKEGVGRMDLLPMCALIRLSKHFEAGANKYGEYNWQKGIYIHSYIDSALRHLAKYVDGQDDEDHLCASAWNLLCAMWTEEKRPDMQDIPARMLPVDKVPRGVSIRRCVEMTCFYNTDGICQSTSERWDPVYGQKCPDFEED